MMSTIDDHEEAVSEVDHHGPTTRAMRFRGPLLPHGESADIFVVGDHITFENPNPRSICVAEGWIVPGMVDAHCHIGLNDSGPTNHAEAEAQATADRDGGALLIRDCGSALDTRWMDARRDLPRLIRAGQHIARSGRYVRNYAREVDPEDMILAVEHEARRGDGWVKIVGDWIARDEGDLAPSFPSEVTAEAVRRAHDLGARVTAHCFGAEVLPGLLAAGIDCIEHGTGLNIDLIEEMARSGVALVPTVMQLEKFPEFAAAGATKYPRYASTMTRLHRRRRATIMAAYEAGVALYAGSDGGGETSHGNLAGEVIAMAALGMSPDYALGAASWRAREWLGWNAELAEGAPADFVVYPRNPLEDLSVLYEPTCVVLRGRVVASSRARR